MMQYFFVTLNSDLPLPVHTIFCLFRYVKLRLIDELSKLNMSYKKLKEV